MKKLVKVESVCGGYQIRFEHPILSDGDKIGFVDAVAAPSKQADKRAGDLIESEPKGE